MAKTELQFLEDLRKVRNIAAKNVSNRAMIPDFLFENIQECIIMMHKLDGYLQKQILYKEMNEKNEQIQRDYEESFRQSTVNLRNLLEVIQKEATFIVARNSNKDMSLDLWSAQTIVEQSQKALQSLGEVTELKPSRSK